MSKFQVKNSRVNAQGGTFAQWPNGESSNRNFHEFPRKRHG